MGKKTTAARAVRHSNRAKRTSNAKLRNKGRQRTPKVVRKQINRTRFTRKQEMQQITGKANKRLQQLSFTNLTTDIKQELSGAAPAPVREKMSRSQRNKFSRENKRTKKQQQKHEPIIDFSTYDREIEDDESSEDEVNEAKDNSFIQQLEQSHTAKSWDVRKSKLSVQSATGQWIHDAEQIDKHYIEHELNAKDEAVQKEEPKDEDGDVVIHENEIADYLNLGQMNDDLEDRNDEDADFVHDHTKTLTVTEWRLKKKQRMNQHKLEIAEMSESILQDPYKYCGLLQVIFNLCNDEDVQICQLAMLSLTRVIIDIMPPYKIGTIDQNIAVKRSSERVREFEKTLLNSYQSYLKHIFKLARIYHSNTRNKTRKRDPKRFILGRCSVKCLLLFIRKCSHFNYTKELIKNAIPLTNCNVEEIRSDACYAMTVLLKHQPINNVTVECVQMLTTRIEKKNFEVHPDQITVFQKLPLQYLEPPEEEKEDHSEKPTKSRWEKEFDKKMKKDAKESSMLDKKKMYTRQKLIIEAIFGVYFYILKLEVASKLLEPALCGMSKFAHLINIELVLDLISVVSEKLKKEKHTLSLACKLHCISTTFKCLSGRGTAIEMDVREHYETIYDALLSVTLNHYEWDQFYLIFECLQRMFGHHASKSLPIERIASFVKRLINISTQLPPCYAVGCQHLARKLMISDPRLYNMLDVEGGYDREYDAFETNPDHSNALSCCLWELTLTSNHYHPFNKTYSRDLSTWSEIPLKLSTMHPDKMMYKYDTRKKGIFRPFVKESKLQKFSMIKHPPKELNNVESMRNMVDWFAFDGRKNKRYYERMKKITRAVMNGNKTAEKTIRNYGKCGDLLTKNRILKDINKEYKLLNKLLQSD